MRRPMSLQTRLMTAVIGFVSLILVIVAVITSATLSRTLEDQHELQPWRRWDGLDCCAPAERLQRVGYDRLIQVDLEDRSASAGQRSEAYDVVVLLHVIEHLFDPLAALRDIARWVKPGGLIIAGTP